jgi:hypothetical protein
LFWRGLASSSDTTLPASLVKTASKGLFSWLVIPPLLLTVSLLRSFRGPTAALLFVFCFLYAKMQPLLLCPSRIFS